MALLKLDRPALSASRTAADTRPGGISSPFADEGAAAQRGANRYGVCSIEDYPAGIGDLSYTHEDAGGFYNYVKQFTQPNFWYQDGNVLSWIYGEEYDDWQGTYGFDACTTEYHSGHGTMDSNGVFSMPMGGTWGGSSWTSSNDMRLGNEVARYLFFSTCLSLRVLDGHTPIRTWDATNLGLRMIFGFETTSVDSPHYGEYFFNKWNANGHKFSKAWLDASWDIDHGQAPSAVACGATQAEAQDRLYNEGIFYTGAVPKTWWWWTWYNAARSVRSADLALPAERRAVKLGAPDFSAGRLAALAEQFGVRMDGDPLPSDVRGVRLGGGIGPSMSIDHRGVREVTLADPVDNADGVSQEEAVRAAEHAVDSFGLATDIDMIVDKVRHHYHAGASRDESVAPRLRETQVVFTQMIDGLPVVTPGLGEVRVGVDGAGRVTTIADATLPVADVFAGPTGPAQPESAGRAAAASNVDELLDVPLQRLLRRLSAGGRAPTEVRTVDDSTAVGWATRDTSGSLAARRVVEVDCGAGLAKRFVLEAPVG